MRTQIVLATLLTILIGGMVSSALAQETLFSARVLAKATGSTVLILIINSHQSTSSIYQFKTLFVKDRPLSVIHRGGWESKIDNSTVTFTAKSAIQPGRIAIFLIKVSDPSQAAFQWSVSDNTGKELQTGLVSKIRVTVIKPVAPQPPVTTPSITVNQSKVNQGGQVIVTGKGFSPLSKVQIFLDDQQLTSSNTNGTGEFGAVVIIPSNSTAGLHMLTAKDALGKSSLIQILVQRVTVQQLPAAPPPPPPTVLKKLVVEVDVKYNTITPGSTQVISVIVSSDGGKTNGAHVSGLVKGASGNTKSFDGSTDSTGVFTFSWQIDSYSTPGTYLVNVSASKEGYESGSASAAFQVVSKSGYGY